MSDTVKTRLNLGLMWSILLTMIAGVYQAGQVRERLDTITAEIKRVRPLEDRVLRIEADLHRSLVLHDEQK